MTATETGFTDTELRKFTDAGRTISAAVGASAELWARSEAGVVLKAWATLTPVATLDQARKRARNRFLRPAGYTRGDTGAGVTINTGQRRTPGRVWYRTPNKKYQLAGTISDRGTVRKAKLHYSPTAWHGIQEAMTIWGSNIARVIAQGVASRGLARQSIIQIADALGIRLEAVKGGSAFGKTISSSAIAQARRATGNGRRYINGMGNEQRGPSRFFIELINRYPFGGKFRMDQNLMSVIRARLRFFEENLDRGVFESAKAAGRAYPYLRVLKTAS